MPSLPTDNTGLVANIPPNFHMLMTGGWLLFFPQQKLDKKCEKPRLKYATSEIPNSHDSNGEHDPDLRWVVPSRVN